MSYKVTSKYGIRFLGNANTKEVHDLTNEKASCQISEILSAGHAVGFVPDTLAQAKGEGFDPCGWCLPGQSTR